MIKGREEVTIGVPLIVQAMIQGRKEVNTITDDDDHKVAVPLPAMMIISNVTTLVNTTRKILSIHPTQNINKIICNLRSVCQELVLMLLHMHHP
jgi:hypothetical protein